MAYGFVSKVAEKSGVQKTEAQKLQRSYQDFTRAFERAAKLEKSHDYLTPERKEKIAAVNAEAQKNESAIRKFVTTNDGQVGEVITNSRKLAKTLRTAIKATIGVGLVALGGLIYQGYNALQMLEKAAAKAVVQTDLLIAAGIAIVGSIAARILYKKAEKAEAFADRMEQHKVSSDNHHKTS